MGLHASGKFSGIGTLKGIRFRERFEISTANRVLFLFIDGLGLGVPDPAVNPLASIEGKVLSVYPGSEIRLPFEGKCYPTDPRLGMVGLPQSATGQTTLFTGVNAAEVAGRHLQGFPNSLLKRLLASGSIFKTAKAAGKQVLFANAYTDRFFDREPRWLSVTTVMCKTSGVPLCRLEDVKRGESLFMDFTNRLLRRKGHDLPLLEPEGAAQVLARLSRQYDLCLYEYFLTDYVGHRGSYEDAVKLLGELDRFIYSLVASLDLTTTSLILTSDHGNVEDMRRASHTANDVPTMVWGGLKHLFDERPLPLSLASIAPLVLQFLGVDSDRV